MSILQNVPPREVASVRSSPPPRVLLLAHSDLSEPTARYLRRLGCDVTAPHFDDPTAEACAALLFPSKTPARKDSEHRLPFSFGRTRRNRPAVHSHAGPPAFFAWSAFDAVVVQDLWRSSEGDRLVPFGCTVVTTDYYVRGNFDQPKIVIATDLPFYGFMREACGVQEEAFRSAFDRNEQLIFIPVLGNGSSPDALARIASAVKRTNGRRVAPPVKSRKGHGRRFARDSDAPEQSRAMSVLSTALVEYIATHAHVVVVDDASSTVRAIAARFGHVIDPKPDGRVHACDVSAGTVVSHASFEELHRDCERVVEHARATNELLLIVTDILFDSVEWDGRRNTGIDLIERLRASQRERHVKMGIIGLTGVASPLVMTSAFHRGADSVVNKSSGQESTLHHANIVDEFVIYKLLLTMASLCFQYEYLYAKRHVDAENAREESAAMRRILPCHAASPHLQAEWEATQYLLESQATYAHTSSRVAERAIHRIREQYD
jgi:CheY-like chemotaxis protein